MAQANTNPNRRRDLQIYLKRSKPDDILTLEECAVAWGTTKQRFVTVRNAMPTFPDRIATDGNVYLYPARKALEAMLAYETRHEAAAKAKQARTNAILGRGKRASANDDTAIYSPSELATLSRMSAELEEREREQGLYVPVAKNAVVAGEVFALISEFMSELSNKLDPHGLETPEWRARIDSMGAEALLGLHRQMKEVLSPDAKPRATRAASNRSRKSSTRR